MSLSDFDNIPNIGIVKPIFENSEEANLLKLKNETFELPESNFMFLNDHYGFRKGCIHLVIGSQGKGKSSLTRSLLYERLEKGNRVFFYATEESPKDIKTSAAYFGAGNELLGNLLIGTEKKMRTFLESTKEIEAFMKVLKTWILKAEAEIFFFDNLTTSAIYNSNNAYQASRFIWELHVLCEKLNIPFVIVAHTNPNKKDNSNQWIDGNDIRGSRDASIRAQYLYAIRTLDITESADITIRKAFVFTQKARNHTCTGNIYSLKWDGQRKGYSGDTRISMEQFNKFYKMRNKIGEK